MDSCTEIFRPYKPFDKFRNLTHPDDVSETTSLSCVSITIPDYQHSIPSGWLLSPNSRLSGVQMDAILLAGAAHNKIIGDLRQGFILGDGTGVGKGREIVGMIADNWLKGRKKAIWISCNAGLTKDARRDLNNVVKGELNIRLDCFQEAKNMKEEGVIFLSYHVLSKEFNKANETFPSVSKLADWFGRSYDGLVIFDEAHKAKGLVLGDEDSSKSTNVGKSVLQIQEVLKNARFVYATATIGTTPSDLTYVRRLGLWDSAAGFGGAEAMQFFIERGLAGSEILAAQLKSRGVMVSRQLSYVGVEFEVQITSLTQDFIDLYDTCAEFWSCVLAAIVNVDRLHGVYWSTTQNFFKALCIASKMPSLISTVREKIAEKYSVVISVNSTHDEQYKRFRSSQYCLPKEDVFRPCQQMMLEFLLKKLRISANELGLKIKQPLSDDSEFSGNESDYDPDFEVQIETKKRKRNSEQNTKEDPLDQNVVKRLVELYHSVANKLPTNPLDHLIMLFSKSPGIVELTSRHNFQEIVRDNNGNILAVSDRARSRKDDASVFQNGTCRIAIISEASSTGISLHCSRDASNKTRRIQIMLETPWTSLSALQSLGRTHRSDQIYTPKYLLLRSPFPGEARFVNAVAGRICSLGALCKADRRSSFHDAWKTFQICPIVAKSAIENIIFNVLGESSYMSLFPYGMESQRTKWVSRLQQIQLIVPTTSKKSTSGLKPCPKLTNQEKFLNRMLVMKYKYQITLMDYFKTAVDKATICYFPERMNDGVESLSSAITGSFSFVSSEVYSKDSYTCTIHMFKCLDVCPWMDVEKSGPDRFYLIRNNKIIAIASQSDTSTSATSYVNYSIFKPQRERKETTSSILRFTSTGIHAIKKEKAKYIWEQQTKKLTNGDCVKTSQGVCNKGKNCEEHRKCSFTFGLLSGVISAVLLDVMKVVAQKEMRLVYHTWGSNSDTGIFLNERHINGVQKSLEKAGFCKSNLLSKISNS